MPAQLLWSRMASLNEASSETPNWISIEAVPPFRILRKGHPEDLVIKPPFHFAQQTISLWSPENVLIDEKCRIWVDNDGWQLLVFTPEGKLIYASNDRELPPSSSMSPWNEIIRVGEDGKVLFEAEGQLLEYLIPELS